MTKTPHSHPERPEKDVPKWIQDLPDEEQADLAWMWHLAAWAREGDGPDASATEAAFDRLRATLALPVQEHRTGHREPPARKWHRVLVPVAVAGIVVLVGALGFWLDVGTSGSGTVAADSPEFIVLVRGGTFAERSAEEQREIVEAFTAWARELVAAERLVAGEQLAEQGRVLAVREGEIVEQAVEEEGNAVGGFFIIAAADYEEAVTIARGCPQLDYGGTVEVRQIVRE